MNAEMRLEDALKFCRASDEGAPKGANFAPSSDSEYGMTTVLTTFHLAPWTKTGQGRGERRNS
jgi:hypothetical protein